MSSANALRGLATAPDKVPDSFLFRYWARRQCRSTIHFTQALKIWRLPQLRSPEKSTKKICRESSRPYTHISYHFMAFARASPKMWINSLKQKSVCQGLAHGLGFYLFVCEQFKACSCADMRDLLHGGDKQMLSELSVGRCLDSGT